MNFTSSVVLWGWGRKKLSSHKVLSCRALAVQFRLSNICTWGFSACYHCSIHSFASAVYSLLLVPWPQLVWSLQCVFFLYPEPCPESLNSGVWSYRYSAHCISTSLLSVAWGMWYREGRWSAQVNLHRDAMLHSFAQEYTQTISNMVLLMYNLQILP